jgi:hypothetical protein
MNTTTAPHTALQAASFVIAFTGEGAACYVVHGGWDAMLARFAQETIGSPMGDLASRTHPNHSEWCMWLESLNDLDEWSTDEGNQPYSFSSEVGEISHVAIYRLSADGVPEARTDHIRSVPGGAAFLRVAGNAGVAMPPAPSQHEAMEMALSALHTAVAGLEWYRDRCPDAVDGSDGEADDEIGAAIAALDAALAAGVKVVDGQTFCTPDPSGKATP